MYTKYKIVSFCPYHFVQYYFVRIPFCPYHFVRTILSATILSGHPSKLLFSLAPILTITHSLLSSVFNNIFPQLLLIALFSLFVCLFSLSLPCTAQFVCLCFTLKNILTYLLMFVASLEHSNTCRVS